MVDPSQATLWLVSGLASLFFLSWALVELVRIYRVGRTDVRRWFLVFLLTMVALVLAGVGGQGLGDFGFAVVGGCFALAGFALYKAARTQRKMLEGANLGA